MCAALPVRIRSRGTSSSSTPAAQGTTSSSSKVSKSEDLSVAPLTKPTAFYTNQDTPVSEEASYNFPSDPPDAPAVKRPSRYTPDRGNVHAAALQADSQPALSIELLAQKYR